MSSEDSPFSLFASAAKKPKPDAALPPVAKGVPVSRSRSTANKRKLEEMIDRMAGIHSEMDRKLEELARKQQTSKEKVWEYLCDVKNFSKEEWGVIEKNNQVLINQAMEIINSVSVQVEKEQLENSGANRKSKYIGARRKWISAN